MQDVQTDRRGVALRCDGARIVAVVVSTAHIGRANAESKLDYARELAVALLGDAHETRTDGADVLMTPTHQGEQT